VGILVASKLNGTRIKCLHDGNIGDSKVAVAMNIRAAIEIGHAEMLLEGRRHIWYVLW
jgi:hypothetical protein